MLTTRQITNHDEGQTNMLLDHEMTLSREMPSQDETQNASRRTFLKAAATVSAACFPNLVDHRRVRAESSQDELAYIDASEAIRRFEAGELSPVDLLKTQIARIERYNPQINCITHRHFEQALEAAELSEKRYREGIPRPLEGIPVAIKDENEVEGWQVTMGSLLLKDAEPSEEDAPIIDFLKKSGAVLHIQTTVPEFYLGPHTATRLWGVTRNPWNPEFTPGGSSGGSGAALAAGFATLATGSDMGGSIRIPSAQCGLYGFKPPFQRVATSETSYESLGPMARNLTDMLLMQNVISGPHPHAHSSLRPKLDYPLEYAPPSGMRVVVDHARGIGPSDSEVDQSMQVTISRLKALGCEVVVKDLQFKYQGDFPIWAKGLLSTSLGMMIQAAAERPDDITPYVREFVNKFQGELGPRQIGEAEQLQSQYQRRIQDEVFTAGFDAIVMPTMLTPFVPADWYTTQEKHFVYLNGKKQKNTWAFMATWIWNMLGRYPVMNMPVQVGKENMPLGIQIIGNTFDDLTCMRLAAGLEKLTPPLFAGNLKPALDDIKVR
ncbi:MAG: amidase [Planctomycetaceae bacterium]|nr:amidase [Planctomycetaceae bacterium]